MRYLFLLLCLIGSPLYGDDLSTFHDRHFDAGDVFALEWAGDVQISPDGERIVYVRQSVDIQTDRVHGVLWLIDLDTGMQRPITGSNLNASQPRWSPDGQRLAFVASNDGKPELYVRWMDAGENAPVTRLPGAPRTIAWSPNGEHIAFVMRVKAEAKPRIKLPDKPEDADWAPQAEYIDELIYRVDGAGYLSEGYSHVFVVPSDGGTPRRLTSGEFNHNGPLNWTADGAAIIFSGNRHEDWRYDPLNSEIYTVTLDDREITALTDRQGPDQHPVLAPDGETIAYLGFDDAYQGYQVTQLYLMNADGSDPRLVSGALDRDVQNPQWRSDGDALFIRYDDQGMGTLAGIRLDGGVEVLAEHVGGTGVGRPYTGGMFSISDNDRIAFTLSGAYHPADVALLHDGEVQRLTQLNADVLGHMKLAQIEQIQFESAFDQRPLQGWIAKPPDFDPDQEYPLILEIHGGPFAAYGPYFSSDIQLYANAGYVVLYMNPRGSTSYGQEFGNLIHHAYPGHDFDDLMSGVDAALAQGYVDPERLYVTGGSGGGVLTAWIVGHTDRFRAAVVQKPVINWYSFALTSDFYNFFYKYWFPGLPWEHPQHYMERSPINYAGEVTTPTMVISGESDYRTPISEAEQFYQALQLEHVDTALVRIPEASHHIAGRPSHLITKINYVLYWFDQHAPDDDEGL